MPVKLSYPSPDVAELRLTDGDNGNRLTTPDIRRLAGYLEELRERAPLVTVIRQDGRDFSLGRVPDPDEHGDPAIFSLLSGCTDAWGALPGLTVAVASGRIEGFAVGFVAQADVSFVGESAELRFPEILNGFAPSIVIGWLAGLVTWQMMSQWVLTGCAIPAGTALRAGLVGEVLPDAELDGRAEKLIGELSALDGPSLLECKRFAKLVAGAPAHAAGRFAIDSLVRQHAERERRQA